MKKANSGLGLVILGVVAIIAVIGLVLLFTRASAEGAYSVGHPYGADTGIIAHQPFDYAADGPQTQTPAASPYPNTKGERPPIMVMTGPSNQIFQHSCLLAAGFRSGQVSCYATPSTRPAVDARGNYPQIATAPNHPGNAVTFCYWQGSDAPGLDSHQQALDRLKMKIPASGLTMGNVEVYKGPDALYCKVATVYEQ